MIPDITFMRSEYVVFIVKKWQPKPKNPNPQVVLKHYFSLRSTQLFAFSLHIELNHELKCGDRRIGVRADLRLSEVVRCEHIIKVSEQPNRKDLPTLYTLSEFNTTHSHHLQKERKKSMPCRPPLHLTVQPDYHQWSRLIRNGVCSHCREPRGFTLKPVSAVKHSAPSLIRSN